MNFKKMVAFGLAAVLTVCSVPDLFVVPAKAADNVIKLTFEDKSLAGSVLRGGIINMRATNTQDCTPQAGAGDQLTVYKLSDPAVDPSQNNPYFEIGLSNSKLDTPYLRPLTKPEIAKKTGLDITQSPYGNYGIITNYAAYRSKADIATGITNHVAGSFEVAKGSSNLLVGATASFELVYYQGRFTTRNPSGMFKKWKTEVFDNPNLYVKGESTNKPESFVLDFTNDLNQRVSFKFSPNHIWQKAVPPDANGNPLPPIPNYNLEEDPTTDTKEYVYEIKFDYGRSDPAANLNVLDPRTELSTLVGKSKGATSLDLAVNPTGNQNPYVRLTVPTDTYQFITQDLKLATSAVLYGEKVKLEWTWDGDKNAADVVVDAGQAQRLAVNRQLNDVTGQLKVKATFLNQTIEDDVEYGLPADETRFVTAQLPITIHGLGTLPNATQYNQIVGDTTTEFTSDKDKELPQQIKLMDVYKNNVNNYTETKNPNVYRLSIDSGAGNGLLQQLIIDCDGDASAVSAKVTLGAVQSEYTFGAPFNTQSMGAGQKLTLEFSSIHASSSDLKLTFRYFTQGSGNTFYEEIKAQQKMVISVKDTSPKELAQLSAFTINTYDKNGSHPLEGFTFTPETYDYTGKTFIIPYATESMTFTPVPDISPAVLTDNIMGVSFQFRGPLSQWTDIDPNHEGKVTLSQKDKDYYKITDAMWELKSKTWIEDYTNMDDLRPSLDSRLSSTASTNLFDIPVGLPFQVSVKVRAQNPNYVKTYTIAFEREKPNRDSSLKTLELVDADGNNFLAEFNPETFQYEIAVPYHIDKLWAQYETNFPQAKVEFNKANEGEDTSLLGKLARLLTKSEQIMLAEPDAETPTNITLDVRSEYNVSLNDENSPEARSKYEVVIRRKQPGTDATLDLAQVFGSDGTTEYQPEPAFDPTLDGATEAYFEVNIPYIAEKIKLQAKTKDPYATMVATIASKEGDTFKLISERLSENIPVKFMETDESYDLLTITVTAEDGATTKNYLFRIYREAPNKDASLKSITITDQETKPVEFLDFEPEQLNYTITVPYEVKKVSITATPNDPNATQLKVNGRKVKIGNASSLIELKYDEFDNETIIPIEVTAQDESVVETYTLTIKRESPSSDARLLKLELTDATDLSPVFAPSKTSYTANVAEKAEGVKITATASNQYAKITIDGKRVESGKPSEIIHIMDVYQTVEIVVTAQDGETTKTYKVKFRNENLIEKTDNADLESLSVKPGEMRPVEFSPSVTSYEVSVEEDVYTVELLPVTADALAKLEVLSGTKEIGDDDDNYIANIQDGENVFTIKVTSSDKTKTKEYTVTVYRNEEDKMGSLKPVTPDDIDYEGSGEVIIVDITKYPRVSAEVFEELRNYPDKKIVFQGNDYSLTFDAADLQKVIPHTTIYDFGMSFTSPLEDIINDKIDEYEQNWETRRVMIYFKYHGELPGPAALTFSLGHKYADERLYWNYYNEERERIDYYGNFKSNSRGTFSVMLDHLSTYIVSDAKLRGTEDKSQSDLDLSAEAETKKVNPNTGEGGNGGSV